MFEISKLFLGIMTAIISVVYVGYMYAKYLILGIIIFVVILWIMDSFKKK